MSYKDLIKLENAIKRVKKEKEGSIVTKSEVGSYFGDTVWPFLNRILESKSITHLDALQDAYMRNERAIFTLCDYALGNYKTRKTGRADTYLVPQPNGAQVVEYPELYKKLVRDICDAIAANIPTKWKEDLQ